MKNIFRKLFSCGLLYWMPACAIAYIWIFLAGTLSDALAPLNLTIFAPGILVVVPALLMPLARGFAAVLASGFLFDVSLPIPFEKMETAALGGALPEVALFGETALNVPSTTGFGVMWMAIFFFSLRFLRAYVDTSSPRHWLGCALGVNFAIFLLWACALGSDRIDSSAFWLGFFADALASSIFIVLAGWWFFEAIVSAYRICGADLVSEREVEEE